MRLPPLLTALVLAQVLAAFPATAAAAPIEITWDNDLAQDHDRANYQRLLLEAVQRSHDLVTAELGVTLRRPLQVEVHSRARYESRFGIEAASTRGAHYQAGAIHVNGGSHLDDRFAGTMVHEMTHAVLDHRGTAGQLPIWLNEGLAERLAFKRRGQEGLAPNQVTAIQYQGRQKTLVPLPTSRQGRWNYLQCYAAALFLEKSAGKDKLLAVVHRVLNGESFERALDRELRWTLPDLERKFTDWVEHLS